jgi:hypothetical protein
MRMGLPELLVILVIAATWLLPLAAAIWALITLKRLRDGQRAVEIKLDTIAHLLQK